MNPSIFHKRIIPTALRFLPERMDSPQARAMLLAIALQESDFKHRRQVNGPALSYFQFELIGVRGTRMHHRTGAQARSVCKEFGYENARHTHVALENNDLLAVILSRLNLFNYPGPLPGPMDHEEGWKQYVSQWRPGRPRQARWKERYQLAWEIVLG